MFLPDNLDLFFKQNPKFLIHCVFDFILKPNHVVCRFSSVVYYREVLRRPKRNAILFVLVKTSEFNQSCGGDFHSSVILKPARLLRPLRFRSIESREGTNQFLPFFFTHNWILKKRSVRPNFRGVWKFVSANIYHRLSHNGWRILSHLVVFKVFLHIFVK